MARLNFVKKARKAIPASGIEIGQSYWWWKRRVNGKGTPRVCSKTKPRRSAYATSSPFLGALMDMEDELNGLLVQWTPAEDVADWLVVKAELVHALGESCSANAQSVDQGMKHGAGAATSEMLVTRADHCSDLAAAMRETASELQAQASASLSENEDHDDEKSWADETRVAEVVAGLVWLP